MKHKQRDAGECTDHSLNACLSPGYVTTHIYIRDNSQPTILFETKKKKEKRKKKRIQICSEEDTRMQKFPGKSQADRLNDTS